MIGSHSAAGAAGDGVPPPTVHLLSRRRALLEAALWVLVLVVVWLLFQTITSFYPGTGKYRQSRDAEQTVTVYVEACHRAGPVSVDGFGYWWVCEVTMPAQDGSTVSRLTRRSILNADDVGHVVELRLGCSDFDSSNCTLGRPASRWLAVAVKVIWLVQRTAAAVLMLFALLRLANAVFGRDRLSRVIRRRSGRQ